MGCLSSPFSGTPRSSRPTWSSRKNVQAEWSKFNFLDFAIFRDDEFYDGHGLFHLSAEQST